MFAPSPSLNRTPRLLTASMLVALLTSAACTRTSPDGSTRTLVLGFGWIRNQAPTNTGVFVSDRNILGLTAGPEGVGAGLLQSHQVSIDPKVASNLVLSVQSGAFRRTVIHQHPNSSP